MRDWRIERDWSYEGSSEAGADVVGGRAYILVHEETAAEWQLSIDLAAGGMGVPPSRFDEVANQFLEQAQPPRRVVLDRDGNVARIIDV